ncbi:C-GCAxxG-C-C family protein [Methanimicrococcus blatticola]|uniref:C_GCAxxG_C_C family probable redox protein n=1 Tax=Methanimicrococcus blatticola TaxID=91560 RepID=A0A484F578_9EURY|nr:C-GCAxxG-C-C family protein [Methanimicrococcus blatticola]MBZ3936364.1 C-GCAxxG-C-C family protein [Methanimicrococcus blatticola]MCC2509526.1 C-GCAxxG-C-C family protein [Methanimicrococcus blatticola]TDQ67580.1 C_GCAxxG_C_C family probable redox protein [Methanimicrococcus blatticola]
MNKTDIGSNLFKTGFNCAQAVFSTFSADYGLDQNTALRIAGGLGSGVRTADVCGAVSGAVLVIGLRCGSDLDSDSSAKELCDKETEEFLRRFRETNGSVVCRELLGCNIFTQEGLSQATTENLFTVKCTGFVVSAITILEEMGY